MTTDYCIGFDADDTLWHNENIFEKVHERYFHLLSKYHDAATVGKALFATEMRNLELYGYGIKGFTLSATETAITLTDGKIGTEEIREIITLGRAMLDHPVEMLPGAKDAVDELVRSYRLILITKGDLRDQERKVRKSGIGDRFQAVEIVSEKDNHAYARIFRRHGIDPKRFLMVGNSVKSDIVPVLDLGGSGVHVPYRITWGHEHADVPNGLEGRLFEAKSLADLPALVAKWRAGAGDP
ncbi:MAG TPA: HAD family hydrolase [Opitutaceae bacterium]|jgi:putative hydrolase of the HAD superfamily|nr:HAD family hydrolase [Opitutaceae bacterium]